MRKVSYYATREALFQPETAATVFTHDSRPSEDLLCAEISRLAYKKFERNRTASEEVVRALSYVGYSEVEFFDKMGSEALGAYNADTSGVIVAFRGTEQDPTDLLTDVEAWRTPWTAGGNVHSGFAHALDWIWQEVGLWLRGKSGPLLFTGHSLGAALATLAASRWSPARLVTFGSPLVGDAVFARLFDSISATRYVNCCDLVCRVPPESLGFTHVGTLRYIDQEGTIHTPASPDFVRNDQSTAREAFILEYAWRVGTVRARDLADHAPLNYVSPFLSDRT